MKPERIWRALLAACAVALLALITFRQATTSSAPPLFVPEYLPGWEALIDTSSKATGRKAIQIVEFIDIECPACASQHTAIKEIQNRFGSEVAVKYIHFPLSIHPFAVAAARRMECARQQGRGSEFLDVAYEKQDLVRGGEFETIRRAAGVVDSARFETCVATETSAEIVEQGRQAGLSAGVVATPTTIVNGWRYRGAIGTDDFIDLVNRLQRHELPAGVQTVLGNSPSGTRSIANGVTTAEFSRESISSAPQLVLSATPLAVFGEEQVDAQFDLTFAHDVHVLGDGRVVTFAPRIGSLLLFGADGKPEKDLSAPGNGPRQWRGAQNIAKGAGDTLVLLDPINRRVNWLTATDGIVRSTRLADAAPAGFVKLAGQLADGALVVHSSGRVSRAAVDSTETQTMMRHTRAEVAVLSRDGILMFEPVRDLRVGSSSAQSLASARQDYMVELFSPSAHVLVWDSLVVVSTSDRMHLDLRNPAGQLVGVISVRAARRPVTPAMRRAEIDRLSEYLQLSSESKQAFQTEQQLLEKGPVADSLPAFDRLLISSDKTLWITEVERSPKAGWTATGFRLDGSIVGSLKGAGPGEPVAFGRDRVVLRTVNEDGVVMMRAYRIQRGSN